MLQMDRPLYGVALYLNPRKFFAIHKKGDDGYVVELSCCFNDVVARMEWDEVIRSKTHEFATNYEDQCDLIFSNKLTLANIETKSPHKSIISLLISAWKFLHHLLIFMCNIIVVDWWRSYGGRALKLQRFAKYVVRRCAWSPSYGRNCSIFEFVSRRLEHEMHS